MKTKELKITIPENHEIDWQESAKQEKIVFKKKDTKPRSWEEYCEQQSLNNKTGYQINDYDCNLSKLCWNKCSTIDHWRNVLPSKELAEAFLAMMQLISLRHDWIHKWSIDRGMTDDWQSDCNDSSVKWCTTFKDGKITVDYFYSDSHSISFPRQEMAKDFMNCFKDLLEIAKPLI